MNCLKTTEHGEVRHAWNDDNTYSLLVKESLSSCALAVTAAYLCLMASAASALAASAIDVCARRSPCLH